MHLFFDLDGTLVDSLPAIYRCVNQALADLGLGSVSEGQVRALVGTPLPTIFQTLLASTDAGVIDRAVAAYRARFDRTGMFESSLFPGIGDALRQLRHRGHSLQVVTTKPAVIARRQVAHAGIAPCFEAIHGPELSDRTCAKADLVHAALTVVGGDPARALMIGDRADDVLAARAQGVRAVAVAWGYGSDEELEIAKPEYVAATVADLVGWIQTTTAQGPDKRVRQDAECG